ALHAAAWAGVPGILALARQTAEQPAPEQMELHRLLAIVGGPEDRARIEALVQCEDLGPERLTLAGTYGSPALVEPLLVALSSEDPELAAAAARAYTKLTGADVNTTEMATVAPEDPADDFEAAFADQ